MSTYDEKFRYDWYIGGAQINHWIGYDLPVKLIFNSSGPNINQIQLSIVDTTGNITKNYSISIDILTLPTPDNINVIPQNLILGCNNTPLKITASGSDDSTKFFWMNTNLDTILKGNVFTAKEKGTYTIKALNKYGCKSRWGNYTINVQEYPFSNVKINVNGYGSEQKNSNNKKYSICENKQYGYPMWANYTSSLYNFSPTIIWDDSSSIQSRTVMSGGNYKVTIKDNNGCSLTDSVSIKILPLPNVKISSSSPNFYLCEGSVLTLILPNGYLYEWSTGENTKNITVNQSGTFSAIVTDTLSKCSNNTERISVQSTPNPDSKVIANGTHLAIAKITKGDKYQWYNNGNLLPSDTGAYLNIKTDGYYYATIINKYGCSNTSENIWATTTGITEQNLSNNVLGIYPNPATDKINVYLPDQKECTIYISDLFGRIVSTVKGHGTISIERGNIVSGIYFVRIDNEINSAKVIFQ